MCGTRTPTRVPLAIDSRRPIDFVGKRNRSAAARGSGGWGQWGGTRGGARGGARWTKKINRGPFTRSLSISLSLSLTPLAFGISSSSLFFFQRWLVLFCFLFLHFLSMKPVISRERAGRRPGKKQKKTHKKRKKKVSRATSDGGDAIARSIS